MQTTVKKILLEKWQVQNQTMLKFNSCRVFFSYQEDKDLHHGTDKHLLRRGLMHETRLHGRGWA